MLFFMAVDVKNKYFNPQGVVKKIDLLHGQMYHGWYCKGKNNLIHKLMHPHVDRN